MTAIYRGPTRGYQLTSEDVLWLARAFVGEAGEDCTRKEASALFWCWMDRFMLVNGRWLTEGWSFAALLRAHSQPINPLWADANTSLCLAHPEACTSEKLARRAYIRSLSVSKLQSLGAYQRALEAQEGTLERAVGSATYDFAACSLTAKQGRPCPGISIGGNCFLTYECLKEDEKKSIIAGEVKIGTSTKTLGISALGVIFGAVVLWAAWTLYKKRKQR